jgi:tetratricopeptide (TPR) repeat protein
MDAPAVEVASWSNTELQTLWTDLYVLAELVHRPNANYFTLFTPNRARKEPLRYTTDEFNHLKRIAMQARTIMGPDPTLRRGAMLHADIAMNVAASPETFRAFNSLAPQRVTVYIGDGQALDIGSTAIHWETARMLVDRTPHDAFARAWYRATAAWMQQVADHDMDHIDHAAQLFPDDPYLLFLDGCMHEILAMPDIQSSVQSMRLPIGFSVSVGSARAELKLAENALRRAVNRSPDVPEWRLHYGRVLDLLGDHDAALGELSHAIGALGADDLEYVASLFVGAAHEAAGRLEAARAAYESAAAQAPAAQSPVLALMELARRRGDRGAALQALQRLSAMADSFDGDDPWWSYSVSHVRNAGELLDALWQPFRAGAPQ